MLLAKRARVVVREQVRECEERQPDVDPNVRAVPRPRLANSAELRRDRVLLRADVVKTAFNTLPEWRAARSRMLRSRLATGDPFAGITLCDFSLRAGCATAAAAAPSLSPSSSDSEP